MLTDYLSLSLSTSEAGENSKANEISSNQQACLFFLLRFGKNRLPHWFYLHACCQITGVILMTIGAIIAFSYFDALQRAQSHAQVREHFG